MMAWMSIDRIIWFDPNQYSRHGGCATMEDKLLEVPFRYSTWWRTNLIMGYGCGLRIVSHDFESFEDCSCSVRYEEGKVGQYEMSLALSFPSHLTHLLLQLQHLLLDWHRNCVSIFCCCLSTAGQLSAISHIASVNIVTSTTIVVLPTTLFLPHFLDAPFWCRLVWNLTIIT